MSFQATRFILGLTDLNSSQKAVAHTLAYHADKDGGNSYPSMETIARESGLQSRRSAQRVVRQLEKKRIIVAMTAKTGGRGRDKATIYRFDLAYKSPVNSDTTVALSDQETATLESPFEVDKQRPDGHESATPAITKRDIRGRKERRPGRTKSHEQSLRVSEEAEQHPSRVQDPHSPSFTSKAHAADEDRSTSKTTLKPSLSPNHPVQAYKPISAAPEVARLQAEILRIPLPGGRTFQINSKIKAVIRDELANGRPAALIFAAAQRIGGAISDRDRMPGLTLADNLAATIAAIDIEQAEAVEQQERKERAAMDEKLEKRRHELTRNVLVQQEEEVGREYHAWRREHPNNRPEGFFPDEFHPSVFERYQLVESLKKRQDPLQDMVVGKQLSDLRREAGESAAIQASVEAQLAAEGYCMTPLAQ